MRRFCFFIVTAFLLASCAKEAESVYSIEGVWGLSHLEVTRHQDGEIVSVQDEDYDPINPVGSGNYKISIWLESDNVYKFTYYEWNPELSSWDGLDGTSCQYLTIDGDKIYKNSKLIGYFKLTKDTLAFDWIGTYLGYFLYTDEFNVASDKEIYIRMN